MCWVDLRKTGGNYTKYTLLTATFCTLFFTDFVQMNDFQWINRNKQNIPVWAALWQNQQNGMCAQRRLRSASASAQSDQSSLSAWRATQWRHSEDWSDWAYAQADLSLRWAHSHFVGFVMKQLIFWSEIDHHNFENSKSFFGILILKFCLWFYCI